MTACANKQNLNTKIKTERTKLDKVGNSQLEYLRLSFTTSLSNQIIIWDYLRCS